MGFFKSYFWRKNLRGRHVGVKGSGASRPDHKVDPVGGLLGQPMHYLKILFSEHLGTEPHFLNESIKTFTNEQMFSLSNLVMFAFQSYIPNRVPLEDQIYLNPVFLYLLTLTLNQFVNCIRIILKAPTCIIFKVMCCFTTSNTPGMGGMSGMRPGVPPGVVLYASGAPEVGPRHQIRPMFHTHGTFMSVIFTVWSFM